MVLAHVEATFFPRLLQVQALFAFLDLSQFSAGIEIFSAVLGHGFRFFFLRG